MRVTDTLPQHATFQYSFRVEKSRGCAQMVWLYEREKSAVNLDKVDILDFHRRAPKGPFTRWVQVLKNDS